MKTCLRKLASAVAALAFIFGMASTTPASAVVIYDYTGANFTFFAGIYSGSDNVTATLTLATPLSANLGSSSALVDITSLPGFFVTMSDGQRTLTSLTATSPLGNVLISTDNTGQIDFWDFSLVVTATDAINSTNRQTMPTECRSFDNTAQQFPTDTSGTGAPTSGTCTSRAGEWVLRSSNGTAVPEPATLALVGAGLAGLGFVRRRRKMN